MIVVSGASPSGMREYGQRFLDAFEKHWPKEIGLLFYTEEPTQLPRGENRIIWDIPGCREFIKKWKNDPEANGRKFNPKWRPRDHGKPYSFRFDAVKFCRQCFIVNHAAQNVNGLLCWLDADVVTYKDVPTGFVESLLPEGKSLSYLGRASNHSEIGFQLYRLPEAALMLQQFAGYYSSERVFSLREWHSAYVFDVARKETGIAAHNLTPNGAGHVWFQAPLGAYLDHCKGERKRAGRSEERESFYRV